jgi:hypothetical protein
MADYAPAVKKKLREGGCWWERQGKGDHEIWYSPHTDRRFPVDNKILSRHTANGIIAVGGPIYRPRPHRLLASSGGAWRGQKRDVRSAARGSCRAGANSTAVANAAYAWRGAVSVHAKPSSRTRLGVSRRIGCGSYTWLKGLAPRTGLLEGE